MLFVLKTLNKLHKYNKTIHSFKLIYTFLQYLFISTGFRIVMQIIISIVIVHCSKFSICRPVQKRKNNIYIYLISNNILKTRKPHNTTKSKSNLKLTFFLVDIFKQRFIFLIRIVRLKVEHF